MKDENYEKYKQFLELFDKKKKGETIKIKDFHLETGLNKNTVKTYMERLDKEGKIELFVENGRLKKIVKL